MNVKQIDLNDQGSVESIVVRMSLDEALYLAKLTGGQNGVSAEAVLTGGAGLNAEVYASLTGELFNRFYEDGVADAVRNR